MDDSKHTQLKPCPFCGGEAKLEKLTEHYLPDGEATYFDVFCPNGSVLDCGVVANTKSGNTTEKAAIDTWNNRPLEADLLQACEAALKLLPKMTPETDIVSLYEFRVTNKLQAAIAKAKGADDAD